MQSVKKFRRVCDPIHIPSNPIVNSFYEKCIPYLGIYYHNLKTLIVFSGSILNVIIYVINWQNVQNSFEYFVTFKIFENISKFCDRIELFVAIKVLELLVRHHI